MKPASREERDRLHAQGNLSTLNEDGSRKWIRPRPSHGRTQRARHAVAYFLIALFASLPWLRMNDKPVLLLDIVHREFTILGTTFFATDTLLLAFTLVTIFVSIFAITAIFGRLWCGWACPQTVYLEFVFRPIERFFDGTPGRAGQTIFKKLGISGPAKFAAYLLLSFFVANVFLAYFVGTDNLVRWVTRPPTEHSVGFMLVVFVTGAMLFDFGYFREQMCIVACPYGRFQSVLLDRHSMIVGYDAKRGEPRGRQQKKDLSLPVLEPAARSGDCVDCGLCVATCPTGIDIRNGLQLECIHCAQCIDACNAVMTKLDRPEGLIRYGTQSEFGGEKRRFWRPRLAWYGTVLTVIITIATMWVVNREPADVLLLNQTGRTFTLEPGGRITNHARLKFTNRNDTTQTFTVKPTDPKVSLQVVVEPVVDGRKGMTIPIIVSAPPEMFARGKAMITLDVTSDAAGFSRQVRVTLLGPANAGAAPTPTTPAPEQPQ